MKKILIIMGTRPEVIKLALVVHALKKDISNFNTKICFTGQHKEMLYQTADYFNIEADFDLKLMKKGQSLAQLTAVLIQNLQSVVEKFSPDIILVQGDTTSAFVGGLIGYYNKIKIGHVEAGLRTHNKYAPFPEEINRRLVGSLADYHFAPTKKARESLLSEGVNENHILLSGNTVIDALLYTMEKIKESPPSLGELDIIFNNNNKIVLITGHRRENFVE